MKAPSPASIAAALLPWFRENARDLPWRRTRDPYAIWISEIMLQQTQVKAVIPYWERWMKSLPDVASLAAAPEEQVLKLWEGLGYYSRARNLQKAARTLVQNHEGHFPRTAAHLLELPGIGRYTAGAIASIAFNEPAAILDGNVIRVLTRLYALSGDPRSRALNVSLWSLAGDLVSAASEIPYRPSRSLRFSGSCSVLNQSLMELGATICTPRDPACSECPVATRCRAFQTHAVDAYPTPAVRRAPVTVRRAVAVVEGKGRFLLRRRPQGGVNAGYWEFPEWDVRDGSAADEILAQELGVRKSGLVPMKSVRHSITHHRIELHVYWIQADLSPGALSENARWITSAQLQALPLTAAHRKIARQLEG
ncbi:MAG: A/G-specific adenine glycosylase [Verrucomicrobiota bacterium]